MKKILVTGGSGFLGSRVCCFFQRKNYQIEAPTHGQMEITDLEGVRKYLGVSQPEIVIHCAAISDTAYAQKYQQESFRMNVIGTEYLAKVTGEMGIRFLFMSSDQIYNGKTITGEAYDIEADACVEEKDDCPINEYGKQKKEAEYRSFLANPDTVALRLSWMYDVERTGMKTNRNLLTNLKEAHKNHQVLSFARQEYRGITNVWEVIENLEKVFEIPAGIYNYGSENEYSTIEVAREAVKVLHLSETILQTDELRFLSCPRNLTMSGDKLRKEGIYFKNTMDGLKHFRCTGFPGMVQY